MATAFLFAGQGAQEVGMGRALAESCGACRKLFSEAGADLLTVMWQGPDEELRRTENAQPALLAVSVAQATHLSALAPAYAAGHSLGQYSALVVAGALRFGDAVGLVRERGRLMQRTVPQGRGAMTAVLGLQAEQVEEICRAAAGVVGIACYNAPGQVVLSGEAAAVAAASARCEEEGATLVELNVSAPFHTPLLEPMVPEFTALLESAQVSDPLLPVIDNVTARPLRTAAEVRRSLAAQITAPVRFEQSLQWLKEQGVDAYVHCGPGRGPLGFAKRVDAKAKLSQFEDLAAGREHGA
jgi:[acyl-carrier-protein] S-malonyltransferase